MTQTRTALVTGANRGIGLSIARSLAARPGIRVIAAAREADEARRAAADIGDGTVGAVLELSDPVEAERRARELESEHGPIDVLVNNAGIMPAGHGLASGVDDLRAALTVNTIAPFALIRALAPAMEARGWGRIVNVSSGWGAFAERFGGPLAYSVSKAALNALTVTVADSLSEAVKVNAVCPGWVRTRMGGPDAHWSPEEAADTPVWLATLPDDGPTGGFWRRRCAIDW